jgi:hypothetical protein
VVRVSEALSFLAAAAEVSSVAGWATGDVLAPRGEGGLKPTADAFAVEQRKQLRFVLPHLHEQLRGKSLPWR